MTRMHALILFAGFLAGYVTRWLQQPRVEREPETQDWNLP